MCSAFKFQSNTMTNVSYAQKLSQAHQVLEIRKRVYVCMIFMKLIKETIIKGVSLETFI